LLRGRPCYRCCDETLQAAAVQQLAHFVLHDECQEQGQMARSRVHQTVHEVVDLKKTRRQLLHVPNEMYKRA